MAGLTRDRDRSCGRAREWLSLRVDGELSELERLLLRRHLGRCAACSAFARTVEAATHAIRTTPHEPPSRSLVPEPAPARARPRLRLAAAAGLATLAAGIGIAVGVVIGSGREGPAPTAPGPTEIAQLPPESQPPTSEPPTVNV
jgi:predicted anti-sigma-YlaC factor YlaD